ncbi:hypothetical protein BGZ76_005014 [Entomortierella beljakovae]|nr:hypothetical protein BGZ76_005014 [Entomortierella beljakovae]
MTTQPPRPKISYKSSDLSFTSSEAARILEETENKDLLFNFIYWDIVSVGGTSRDILRLSDANHKFTYPQDRNSPTTFSCYPILKIEAPNGKELIVSESIVIDIFLAERFGFLGGNKYESLMTQSFYSNIHYLRERTVASVLGAPDDHKKKARDNFLNHTLKNFLEDHEYHLRENGNNGHYIGDKTSLADIHLSNIIHFYGTLPWGNMALDIIKDYESVWKVKETFEKLHEIVEWRSTQEFKALEYGSTLYYKRSDVPNEDV